FSPGYDPTRHTPRNPFHTREFSDTELADLLSTAFPSLTRYRLHHGSRLRALDRECHRRISHGLIAAQLATPPDEWPPWLRPAVAGVTADDFTLSTERVASALDLVVVARRPSRRERRCGGRQCSWPDTVSPHQTQRRREPRCS